MFITCLIPVTVFITVGFGTKVPFISKEQVTGIIKAQNATNYLGDFSIEASSKRYIGDYTKVLVSKELCVETNVASL